MLANCCCGRCSGAVILSTAAGRSRGEMHWSGAATLGAHLRAPHAEDMHQAVGQADGYDVIVVRLRRTRSGARAPSASELCRCVAFAARPALVRLRRVQATCAGLAEQRRPLPASGSGGITVLSQTAMRWQAFGARAQRTVTPAQSNASAEYRLRPQSRLERQRCRGGVGRGLEFGDALKRVQVVNDHL